MKDQENKPTVEGHIYFFIFLILVILIAFLWKVVYWLAGVSVGDFLIADSEAQIKLLESMKIIPTVEIPPKVIKTPPAPKKQPTKKIYKDVSMKETKIDLDRLALAVAKAETGNCTEWYGVTHHNCHGIKSGNTYPCKTRPGSKMCIFKDNEESFIAFKVIWGKWYKTMPNLKTAQIWTGKDKSVSWLYNVNHHYNK